MAGCQVRTCEASELAQCFPQVSRSVEVGNEDVCDRPLWWLIVSYVASGSDGGLLGTSTASCMQHTAYTFMLTAPRAANAAFGFWMGHRAESVRSLRDTHDHIVQAGRAHVCPVTTCLSDPASARTKSPAWSGQPHVVSRATRARKDLVYRAAAPLCSTAARPRKHCLVETLPRRHCLVEMHRRGHACPHFHCACALANTRALFGCAPAEVLKCCDLDLNGFPMRTGSAHAERRPSRAGVAPPW